MIFIFILIIFSPLLIKFFWELYLLSQGAFFSPSSDKRIEHILKLAQIKSTDKIIDLGSGDGRVVLAMAKKGGNITGIEIDPYYFWKSKKLIKGKGLNKKIQIKLGNFWKENLSGYDVIVVYGIKYVMGRLEKKILNEAKKTAKIISVYFTFSRLKLISKSEDVYLYSI